MTWISVDDRLPISGIYVLVFASSLGRRLISVGGLAPDGWCLIAGSWIQKVPYGVTVTHWMPLPAPPADRVAQPIDVDDDENDEKPLRCDRCCGEDFLWCDAFYPDRRVSRHVCQRCGNTASTVTQWHTQQPLPAPPPRST